MVDAKDVYCEKNGSGWCKWQGGKLKGRKKLSAMRLKRVVAGKPVSIKYQYIGNIIQSIRVCHKKSKINFGFRAIISVTQINQVVFAS